MFVRASCYLLLKFNCFQFRCPLISVVSLLCCQDKCFVNHDDDDDDDDDDHKSLCAYIMCICMCVTIFISYASDISKPNCFYPKLFACEVFNLSFCAAKKGKGDALAKLSCPRQICFGGQFRSLCDVSSA